jgi:hypothetical protein
MCSHDILHPVAPDVVRASDFEQLFAACAEPEDISGSQESQNGQMQFSGKPEEHTFRDIWTILSHLCRFSRDVAASRRATVVLALSLSLHFSLTSRRSVTRKKTS